MESDALVRMAVTLYPVLRTSGRITAFRLRIALDEYAVRRRTDDS